MITKEIKERFLRDTDKTGRFIVKSIKTGRSYYVEALGSEHSAEWGDLDPASKKMSGDYGDKYPGCVNEKDSLITEENGFVNITTLEAGVSPLSYINELDKKYENS